jgi:hypothetical protein
MCHRRRSDQLPGVRIEATMVLPRMPPVATGCSQRRRGGVWALQKPSVFSCMTVDNALAIGNINILTRWKAVDGRGGGEA